MVVEIKKHTKSARDLINKYNNELEKIYEVITKSFDERIQEVREEERKKAEDALNQLSL
jgi:hypothetical protein